MCEYIKKTETMNVCGIQKSIIKYCRHYYRGCCYSWEQILTFVWKSDPLFIIRGKNGDLQTRYWGQVFKYLYNYIKIIDSNFWALIPRNQKSTIFCFIYFEHHWYLKITQLFLFFLNQATLINNQQKFL